MHVTKRNPLTGKDTTLDLPITEGQLVAWQKGMVAQRAFPNLTADQREFIISGIPPGEFERSLAFPVDPRAFGEGMHGGRVAFVAEASDCGLPPGSWPDLLKFSDGSHVFELQEQLPNGDEVGAVIYRAIDGDITLKIYND